MSYRGDINLDSTIDIKFCTVTTTGAPTQLAGTPVISAYPDNSITQLTAGITLTVDFDTVTGLNNVRVVATGANGYATATNYDLVITTGTVGGTSVVGYVVGSFSIEKRSSLRPATAGRTLVVDASGLADANTVKVGPTGAGTAQTANDIGADVDAILVETIEIGAAGAGLTAVPWNNPTWNTNVKSQVETVINAYEPAKISVSGRLIDVSAAGNVGIDWNNIDAPTTTQNLSGTTVSAVSGAVGSVTGNVGGNVTGSIGSLVANAIDQASIHSGAAAKLADSGIQRGASFWENNADNRSLAWAISKLVNKVDLSGDGTTLSIRKSNDSTALFTQAVTTSGGAAPVVSLDTTG